jgi:poly-gamma-glutamate capsule biosynthesis protein CapA/YwtB (metallophosphatase superfamily)
MKNATNGLNLSTENLEKMLELSRELAPLQLAVTSATEALAAANAAVTAKQAEITAIAPSFASGSSAVTPETKAKMGAKKKEWWASPAGVAHRAKLKAAKAAKAATPAIVAEPATV